MRKAIISAAALAMVGVTSYADLQNVELNGGIRIRGNSYYSPTFFDSDGGQALQFTEQRTHLGVTADFSDEVSAYIEFDSYGFWGDETRDTLNGAGAGEGSGDVSLYQAYIHLGSAWDTGWDIKIGRQEIMLGTEWLIGNKDTAAFFNQLSYDGITGVYTADTYNVTLMSLKVDEVDAGSAFQVDNDTDIYGIYASYTGREDMTIDGYLLYTRAGVDGTFTNPQIAGATGARVIAAGGVALTDSNFDHFTIGGRVGGTYGAWDYEVELAYQTGDSGFENAAGDDIDLDGLGGHFEVGYTFDTNWAPRVYGGIAYFEGGDEDGDDIGFNRIYSDWEYSEFLSNADLFNAIVYRAGVSAEVTEKIGVLLALAMFQLEEEESIGGGSGFVSGFAGNDEDDLGWEVGLYATYQYSEDVAMEFGYAHFFNGDLIEDTFADSDDDPDYFYAEISLSF